MIPATNWMIPPFPHRLRVEPRIGCIALSFRNCALELDAEASLRVGGEIVDDKVLDNHGTHHLSVVSDKLPPNVHGVHDIVIEEFRFRKDSDV